MTARGSPFLGLGRSCCWFSSAGACEGLLSLGVVTRGLLAPVAARVGPRDCIRVSLWSLSPCAWFRVCGSSSISFLPNKCAAILGLVGVSLRWWFSRDRGLSGLLAILLRRAPGMAEIYRVRAHDLQRCYNPLNGGIWSRVKGSYCCLSFQSRNYCVRDVVSTGHSWLCFCILYFGVVFSFHYCNFEIGRAHV